MKSRVPLLALAVIMLVPDCSPRIESASHRFETAIIDDVLTVTNSGGPRYTEPLFTYEEILRLKEDPENEASLLYQPMQFIQDEESNFYVVDRGNNRVAIFDHDGNFVRGIGRSGEGPGEFQGVGQVSVDQDVIQAFDIRNSRLTRFRTDGTLIDVTSLNQVVSDLGIDFLSNATITADNRLVLIGQMTEMTSEFVYISQGVAVLGPGREVEWQAATPRHKTQSWGMIMGRRGLGVIIPYHSSPSVWYYPGYGLVINPADEPVLLLHDLDGKLIKKIRIELEARPVTAEDRSFVLDSFDRRIADASERSVEQLRAMKEGTVFPDRWPYWSGASMDNYGYIWLTVSEREDVREAAGGGYLKMLLSPEGEYLGNTRLPTGMLCFGRIMHRAMDEETGAANLIVYEIRSAIEGFEYP